MLLFYIIFGKLLGMYHIGSITNQLFTKIARSGQVLGCKAPQKRHVHIFFIIKQYTLDGTNPLNKFNLQINNV